MTEQLAIDALAPIVPAKNEGKPLTRNQQLAWEYIRERSGVTADEIGAHIHAHRDQRPHSVDARCEWCAKTGRQTAESKGLKTRVTYKRAPGGRLYVVRDKADRVRDDTSSGTIAISHELAPDDPFYGL